MLGPPIIPETPEDAGELTASISITRSPLDGEPFIQFSYEVSMRVFTIALILHQLELKASRRCKAWEAAAESETKAAKKEAEAKSKAEHAGGETTAGAKTAGRATSRPSTRRLSDIKKSVGNRSDK